jgi:hypothetical protein
MELDNVNEPAALHFQQNGNREEGDDNEGNDDGDEGDDANKSRICNHIKLINGIL